MSNFTEHIVNDKRVILLKNQIDKSFTIMAQQAKIGGAILPSGFKVPDGDWTIIGNCLVQDYTVSEEYSVYLSISEGVPE